MVLVQSFAVLEVEILGEPPSYHRGKGFALAATATAALVILFYQLYLRQKITQKLANRNTEEIFTKRSLRIEKTDDNHPDLCPGCSNKYIVILI